MKEKIGKNFLISCIVGGTVVANYYANSLLVIPELKEKYHGCEVEVFDVSKYGFSFGDAPVFRIHGGTLHEVMCVETGKIWRNARECCEEIKVPLKTLYTAIRRFGKVYGRHYQYAKTKEEDEK